MDKSKEYIEMCKVVEIQGAWKPRWGDFIEDDGLVYPLNSISQHVSPKTEPFVIWLPSQDQLQKMIDWDNYHECESAIGKIDEFWWFCHPKTKTRDYDWEQRMLKYVWLFDSFEKLWLAFVMHEKYQKKWDGKEWKNV